MRGRGAWVALTGVVGLVLAVAGDRLLEPLPWPGFGVLAGGIVASWIAGGSARRPALAGGAVGTLAGVGAHLASHWAEGRMEEPVEGMATHLVVDAGIGLLAGAPALLFTLALAWRLLEARGGAEPGA